VEHFYVKFGDPSCSGFFRYLTEKQTERRTGRHCRWNPTPRHRRRGWV